MSLTIVSGGQTGVDRGSLEAAITLGLAYGGWAPRGWLAEDGTIPEVYRSHMRESANPDYGLRTRLNVQDSDGTLIISFEPELTGGTAFTARCCREQRKPAKHIVLPSGEHSRVPPEMRDAVTAWIRENRIAVLNVAGPRESKEPGIQEIARLVLVYLLRDLAAEALQEFMTGGMALLEGALDSDAPRETFAPPVTPPKPGEFDNCDCPSHQSGHPDFAITRRPNPTEEIP